MTAGLTFDKDRLGYTSAIRIIIFGATIIRIITFFLSDNYGADAINRSYISSDWLANPFFIWHPNDLTLVWLPLPFYLNGLALLIWDNVVFAPRLVSLLLGIASLPLFYKVARQIFDRQSALYSILFFSLYTLSIKHGNIASTESAYLFFLLLVMATYQRAIKAPTSLNIILIGLSLLAAVMVRFEAWVLIPLLGLALFYNYSNLVSGSRAKYIGAVCASFLIPTTFICFWLYGSYLHYGEYLFSVNEAAREHAWLMRANIAARGQFGAIAYNIVFWPAVLLLTLSPIGFWFGMCGIWRGMRDKIGLVWIAFFLIIVTQCLYHSIIAFDLAPLARYSISPGIILTLFGGYGIGQWVARRKIRFGQHRLLTIIGGLMLLWVVLLSLNYSAIHPLGQKLSSVSPITRHPAQVAPLVEWLENNVQENQTVMFNTNNFLSRSVLFASGLNRRQAISTNEYLIDIFIARVEKSIPDYLIIQKSGPLYEAIMNSEMEAEIRLGKSNLELSTIIGEFGIYQPQIKH